MVGSIVKHAVDADYRITCKRSLLDGINDTLLNCGEVVLRNGSADDFIAELIGLGLIAKRAVSHLDVTVLAVSAGLLLVLVLNVRGLADGLSVSYLRSQSRSRPCTRS